MFIVFMDGTVGLGNFYTNGWLQQSLGRKGRVLATSWYQGQLAVVTRERGLILTLALYETAVSCPDFIIVCQLAGNTWTRIALRM